MVWDLAAGRVLVTPGRPAGATWPEPRRYAAGVGRGPGKVWPAPAGGGRRHRGTSRGDRGRLSPDGGAVVSASSDATPKVWDGWPGPSARA
jgi:hypothetical protein